LTEEQERCERTSEMIQYKKTEYEKEKREIKERNLERNKKRKRKADKAFF
jgi:hypothetical protein